MAVVFNTPGVYTTETDLSQYVPALSNTIAGIVTPASRGPLNTAILVTTYQELINNFGYPAEIYPGMLVARDFLKAGGTQMFIVRVANMDVASTTSLLSNVCRETVTVGGSYHAGDVLNLVFTSSALSGSPITASFTAAGATLTDDAVGLTLAINSNATLAAAGISAENSGAVITVSRPGSLAVTFSESVTGSGATTTLTLADVVALDPKSLPAATTGTYSDNLSGQISYSHQKTFSTTCASWTLAAVSSQTFLADTTQRPLTPGTIQLKLGGTLVAKDDSVGNLVFTGSAVTTALGSPATASGFVNYATGVLTVTILAEAGTPTVTVVVLGNYWQNFTLALSYTLLDSNSNVITTYPIAQYGSLTPANFATALAGNAYVDASAITLTEFPQAGNYTFSGGDDGITELTDADYVGDESIPSGMQVFAFPDQIAINVIAVPGQGGSVAIREALTELVLESRSDCLLVIAPPIEATTTQQAADWANGAGAYASFAELNNTYTAIYYPWYQTFNSSNNSFENTPPEAAALAAMARSDYFQAPAGPNRGMILNATNIQPLSVGDREFLANERINPLSNIQQMGLMVAGQRTATLIPSSLDRVGARNVLMRLETASVVAVFSVLFELDNPATWLRVQQILQPMLDHMVSLGRLRSGNVICDYTTNTPEVVENNQLVANVIVMLPKYAEQIILNFVCTESSITITEGTIPLAGVA